MAFVFGITDILRGTAHIYFTAGEVEISNWTHETESAVFSVSGQVHNCSATSLLFLFSDFIFPLFFGLVMVHLKHTLNNGQQDDDDKEEEGDVEQNTVKFIWIPGWIFNLITDATTSPDTNIHVK